MRGSRACASRSSGGTEGRPTAHPGATSTSPRGQRHQMASLRRLFVLLCGAILTSWTQSPLHGPRVYSERRYRGLTCLLYTSDAADEEDSVDLGGRRIIKKKKKKTK